MTHLQPEPEDSSFLKEEMRNRSEPSLPELESRLLALKTELFEVRRTLQQRLFETQEAGSAQIEVLEMALGTLKGEIETLKGEKEQALKALAEMEDRYQALDLERLSGMEKVRALTASLDEVSSRYEGLSLEWRALEGRHAALLEKLHQKDLEISGTYASLSWRLTSPLRCIKAWFFPKRRKALMR